MAVKSILPALICDFNSGATLTFRVSCRTVLLSFMSFEPEEADLLWRVGGVNNNRLLGRLIRDQVGIVVAFSGPCKA